MNQTCRNGCTWGGSRTEHCPECCQTFSGNTAGDKHRVGDHAVFSGPDRRRCLTVAEMEDAGFHRNKHGYWSFGEASTWWEQAS